jgi:hypothetical protein
MRHNQKVGYARQKYNTEREAISKSLHREWIKDRRAKWASDLKYEDWTFNAMLLHFGPYYKRSVIANRWLRMRQAANARKRS